MLTPKRIDRCRSTETCVEAVMLGFSLGEWIVIALGFQFYSAAYLIAQSVAGFLLKVPVEIISFGHGRTIGRWKLGQTEIRIGSLPFGGYTKFFGVLEDPDQNDSSNISSSGLAFSRLRPSEKVLVLSAGPIACLGLAFLLFTLSWLIGRVEPKFIRQPASIAWCRPGSALQKAGLLAGDKIKRANYGGATIQIESWRDFLDTLKRAESCLLRLEFQRGSESKAVEARVGKSVLFDVCHPIEPLIGSVSVGSPGEQCGFRVGDRIETVADQPVSHWLDFETALFSQARTANGLARSEVMVRVLRLEEKIDLHVLATELLQGAKKFGVYRYASAVAPARQDLTSALRHAGIDSVEAMHFLKRLLLKEGEFSRGYRKDIPQYNGYRGLVALMYSTAGSRVVAALGILGIFQFIGNLVPLQSLNGGHIARALLQIFRVRPLATTRSLNMIETCASAALFSWLIYVVFW